MGTVHQGPVLFSSTELEFAGTDGSTPFAGRLTTDNEDPLYGAGVRFTIIEPLQVFLDVTYLDDVGERDRPVQLFQWDGRRAVALLIGEKGVSTKVDTSRDVPLAGTIRRQTRRATTIPRMSANRSARPLDDAP